MTQPQPYNATIVARRDLHEGLCFLHISPDQKLFPPFEPGQFVSVGRNMEENGVPSLVKRSYSIGSSAAERSYVELFVVHVDDGEFTSWLFAQQVGSRVWLSPKASGGFTLQHGFTHGRDLVLVSTGTAIAPCVSMYRTYRDNPPWRRIIIMNGVRYARDLGYREELEAASRSDATLLYLPTVTRESAGTWNGARGRVNDLLDPARFQSLTGTPLAAGECHVYLAGNPEMIELMEADLAARGFHKHTPRHPGTLHLEKYWTD